MSAVDEIRDAIATLEQLKAESGTAAYVWLESEDGAGFQPHEGRIEAVGYPDDFDNEVARTVDIADAKLIVTLHRTIDAQLAILQVGDRAYTEYRGDGMRALDHDKAALELARAINGGVS